MKNSTLLTLGTAFVAAFLVGCGTTTPRTTPLGGPGGPGGTGGDSSRTPPNLNTDPVAGKDGAGGSSVPVPIDLPDNDKLSGREHNRAAFAAQSIYFEFDQHVVRSAEAEKLGKVAAQFKSLPPGHDILVEGNCDERGTEGYNQSLGERRALALRELLIKDGVDGQHVFTKSLGKDHPAVVGHDEAAWSRNRRGEFILVLPKKITTTQGPK